MGVVDDVLKALDRIPVWKRLGQVPGEVDDLQKRVSSLETMLGGKWAPDVCRFCGERAVRMTSNLGPDRFGKMIENWTCGVCNQVDERRV